MAALTPFVETPYSFNFPSGVSFSEYCTAEPKRGDWIPLEEEHYIVIRRREDGSFDLAAHPRAEDIAAHGLDFSAGSAQAFASAKAIATDPATVAAVLAKHPE